VPSVRISLANWEADLAAVVWPGVSLIYHPRSESAQQIEHVAALLQKLEKLRGIRPGTVELRPLIETPKGVCRAYEIASASRRIQAFGVGPNISLGLGGDALAYARAECELAALALGLEPIDVMQVLD
jgi:citrate lyase subunit beta / citryl-CoA lyase